MQWPLIETWAALPRKSEAYLTERQWFDLKETYAPDKRAEMAKDVAAFANALGGILIIGAKEGPTEPDYTSPVAATHAEKVALAFDQAVRDFCRRKRSPPGLPVLTRGATPQHVCLLA